MKKYLTNIALAFFLSLYASLSFASTANTDEPIVFSDGASDGFIMQSDDRDDINMLHVWLLQHGINPCFLVVADLQDPHHVKLSLRVRVSDNVRATFPALGLSPTADIRYRSHGYILTNQYQLEKFDKDFLVIAWNDRRWEFQPNSCQAGTPPHTGKSPDGIQPPII